jgi:hypothetical protein
MPLAGPLPLRERAGVRDSTLAKISSGANPLIRPSATFSRREKDD